MGPPRLALSRDLRVCVKALGERKNKINKNIKKKMGPPRFSILNIRTCPNFWVEPFHADTDVEILWCSREKVI